MLQFSNLRNINYLKLLSFSSCNSFVVGLNFFIMKNACHLSLFHLLPVQHLHIWFGYIFIPYGQPVIITKLQSHKFRGNISFWVNIIESYFTVWKKSSCLSIWNRMCIDNGLVWKTWNTYNIFKFESLQHLYFISA